MEAGRRRPADHKEPLKETLKGGLKGALTDRCKYANFYRHSIGKKLNSTSSLQKRGSGALITIEMFKTKVAFVRCPRRTSSHEKAGKRPSLTCMDEIPLLHLTRSCTDPRHFVKSLLN